MKERQMREKAICSIEYESFPTSVTCPYCSSQIEIWSDEDETSCKLCGFIVFQHENIVH